MASAVCVSNRGVVCSGCEDSGQLAVVDISRAGLGLLPGGTHRSSDDLMLCNSCH